MPELKHDQLDRCLEKEPKAPDYPVYLIFGDELLCKTAFNALLDALMPASRGSLNYDPIDDTDGNIYPVIEKMNTFSLQPGPKAVALIDSKLFYAKQDDTKLLATARETYEKNQVKKAAGIFATLLGNLDLSFEEAVTTEGMKKLKADPAADMIWIEALCGYSREHNIRAAKPQDSMAALDNAISKGFPRNNHLFITTDMIDRRRNLYKIILQKGLVVDCSVPKGDRREDRLAQESVMNREMTSILSRSGKAIEKDAVAAIVELTGFDLRTVSHNLEKLISFIGDRETITVDDVDAVLERTRKDPIYEMTNAVGTRDIQKALHFLEAMLSDNIHPLQLLAAISNQIRKLIMAKGFLEGEGRRCWHSNMNYTQFRRTVMPEIQAHDGRIRERLRSWEGRFHTETEASAGGKKKKKGRPATDLVLARNPNNAYPVFQTLLKADGFAMEELRGALESLARADVLLKSTGQKPKTVLESTLFSICRPHREQSR